MPDINVEFSIDDLPSSVTLSLYADPSDLGFLAPTFRNVVIEAGVTTPTGLIFNDWDVTDEVRTLTLTLQGDSTLDGNLMIPTRTNKDGDLIQQYFGTLTINSVGTAANEINGNITTAPPFPVPTTTSENSLLNVVINATQNLVIDGNIAFNSVGTDGNADTATLTLTGTANVTIDHLDITNTDNDDIGTLALANNLVGGTLTVLGGTPAVLGSSSFAVLTISGTGNTVLGVDPLQNDEDGIDSATLSVINASGSSGALTIGTMVNVDSQNFSFTSGTGVTKVWLDNDQLNENVPADTGWSFNFANAAAGSELHIGSNVDYWEGQLSFNMGANGTLYLDNTNGAPVTVDLTDNEVFLSYVGANAIVLGDGITLKLRADQANGLNIVAGANTNDDGNASQFTGVVNIEGLDNDVVYDFGGIIPAGTITLAQNDVTVETATDLGTFSITLLELANTSASMLGQTIRFNTEAQATRDIIVDEAIGNNNDSSTNVVWLFNSIAAAGGIDTSGYDGALGRLVFYAALLANEGGDVEQLFTTLPSTILRVDVMTLAELNILLQSNAVDRVMEIVHFATVGDLTFSDVGVAPEEHLNSLTLHLGGQTTVGNILINDVVANPADTDLTNIDFTALTIVSHRAVRTGDTLASELFVNNNNGIVEAVGSGVENVQPTLPNIVGNIGVGAGNSGVDLVRVNIDTLGLTTLGNGSAGSGGAIQIGTITYGYTPGTTLSNVATLDVTGANNVTIASVIATDADLAPAVLVDVTGFTATLSAPGTSPAIQLGAHIETLTFTNTGEKTGSVVNFVADAADTNDEMLTVNYVLNGVAASVNVDLTGVDVTNAGAVAAAVATELNSIAGVNASVLGAALTVNGDANNTASITSLASGGGVLTTLLNSTIAATGGTVNLGSTSLANPNAGVIGAGLSTINAANFGGALNLGILALVDGTNDDSNPLVPGNDGLVKAFQLIAGSGVTTATLGKDPDSANVPTLAAGSEWVIDYTNAAIGSRFTITDDVVFGAPALPGDPLPKLTLLNVDLFITGDVDLTGVDLSGINGASDIFVAAGNSLTITPAQAEALAGGVVIEGEGTVHIVGDASDTTVVGNVLSLWPHVRTVNVDLSGVTISADPLVDADSLLRVDLHDNGAYDDTHTLVGFNVVGSAFADYIEASNLNDTIDGGAGNDELLGNGGSDTFLVTAGTDTILDLAGNGAASAGADDVLVVSAGATALATGITEFIATADTVNNGTATLSTAVGGGTINVAAAGGANGFNLTGGAGADMLIGSNQVDVILGGGGVDVQTGNGGADIFRFTTSTSTPQAMTGADTPTVPGEDWERVNITGPATADGVLTIPYTVNNGATLATVQVNVVNGDDAATIAASVRTAFLAAGFFAVIDGTSVEVRGALGSTLELGDAIAPPAGVAATAAEAVTNVDAAQETVITIGTHLHAIVVGEVYTLSFALAGGDTTFEVKHTATTTLEEDVASGLAAKINALGGALSASANVGFQGEIVITDLNEDNGGFTVVPSSTGGFNGSSASSDKADASTFDLVTDFGTGADKIDFQGLVVGSLANYLEGGQNGTLVTEATFADALFTAEAQINGTVRYFLTSVDAVGAAGPSEVAAAGKGVLFFDADGDGVVDGGVLLTGVTSANFEAGFITASAVPV